MGEQDGDKLYYSIKEVAMMFGENVSTLRYWEKEFPEVINPRRNAARTRFYDDKDIEDVRLIYHLLRERKMKLDGARKILKHDRGREEKQAKVMRHLKNIKKELKSLAKAFDEADKKRLEGYGFE